MKTLKDKTEFKRHVHHWAKKLDVNIQSLSIRPMKNKWASCSAAGNLNFNNELLDLEKDVGDYVIVHELLHFFVPNFGKLRKSLMRAHLGAYELMEARLKELELQGEVIAFCRQRYAPFLGKLQECMVREIEQRFASIVAEKQKRTRNILQDNDQLDRIFFEVQEWSKYNQMPKKKLLEAFNTEMESELHFLYRDTIEPRGLTFLYHDKVRKGSVDIHAAFFQIFKSKLLKKNPNDRYCFIKKCLIFLFVYYLIRAYLQDGEPLELNAKVFEIYEKTNLKKILNEPELVFRHYPDGLKHLDLNTFDIASLGFSGQLEMYQVSEFITEFTLALEREGLLRRRDAASHAQQTGETRKKKRKKENSDEELANLYFNYINKTGDKNPTAERLADNSNPGYSTWHRRLKKPSFQQLLLQKFEVMGEHLVHLEKTSAKKSPHIRREIPKSHKETSFDELPEEEVNFTNPIVEIENRIDEDRIDEMSKDECIYEILNHPNSPNDKFTADELEDMKLKALREVLKVLEKGPN